MTDERILTVGVEDLSSSTVLLCPAGEIDRDSQTVLHEAATAAFGRGADRLIIDLTEVTFCDSGGLSLFVRLDREAAARGGSLRLAAARPAVRAILDVVNFDRLMSLHETVAEAVQASRAEG
ncbi:hypothetical protein GCM10010172_81270 [Paractinoplanes ferrugineus]|uniref:Anti-sigma factor antagonist n=1 Tax=Paractinoplanes ferrugineus TaxID=113564 RepID=A0A919IYA9_9ACTN|nr:STAS domain-containing protein [Actinoplanes ferrugineus]GIE10448.1 hypothetical protein Afe05nite_22880 [Actinoplanes ferrugineus]